MAPDVPSESGSAKCFWIRMDSMLATGTENKVEWVVLEFDLLHLLSSHYNYCRV